MATQLGGPLTSTTQLKTLLFAGICGSLLVACGSSESVSNSDNGASPAVSGSVSGPLANAAPEPLDVGPVITDPVSVASPDGRTIVRVWSEAGEPHYAIERDGVSVLANSQMGFRFAEGPNLEAGLVLTDVLTSSHDESWEQPWGERRVVRDHHNELAATFTSTEFEGGEITVRFRVFDAGVGFRFEVERGPDGDSPVEITDELTEFHLASTGEAWWTPAHEFNRYEYIYSNGAVEDAANAHTPFTVRLEGGQYLAIHEAALVDYSAMSLDQRRDRVFEAELRSWSDGGKVRTSAHFSTPWRTIQIADDAQGLINGTDITLNLNEPNVLGDVSWLEPGNYIGIWWGMHLNEYTWGSGPNHGATTERTRDYIDFAAENGFVGVLVEGWNIGWDGDWFNNGEIIDFTTPYPDFDLEGLSAYAEERGVRLIGHHETSAAITNYESQMEDAFALYERMGIRAVKTGYVDDAGEVLRRDEDGHARYEWHDSQFMVGHHARVAEVAARHRVAINAHEPIKDTGLRRTYPNLMTREGVRGQEFNAWGDPPNGPSHTPTIAYTRMLAGPADFTPGIFDLTFERSDGRRGVQTTLSKQLALYVVLYSPLQMAADLIENYNNHPEMFQFIRDVPADWEESIALQGEVGEYVVQARQDRASQDWYLGAITDETPRGLSVPLDFLEDGVTYTAQIYRDRADAHWLTNPYAYVVEERQVTSADVMELPLAASGGAAIRFVAP